MWFSLSLGKFPITHFLYFWFFKRWVAGYRPDDYVMAVHMERTLEDELKMFKSIKLASKSSPLQDVIQQLVDHVVPVAKKQYVLHIFVRTFKSNNKRS